VDTQLFDYLIALTAAVPWAALARALVLLALGLILARLYRRLILQGILRQLPGSQQRIGQRVGSWLIIGLFAAAALHQLGFNLSVLLGAAGVLSVAIGFASQTSAANLISGLFLLGERTIQPGDNIQVGIRTGEVLSVDLLSVKLRTPDNLYVRIPNEMLIKNEMVNLSKLPIRRFDLKVSVDYAADLAQAKAVLLEAANDNLICLEEPKPAVIHLGFAESAVDLQLSVWAARERFGDLRNTIQEEVKRALDAAGIAIPFPQRSLQLAAQEQPLRVAIEQPQPEQPT
jgi:small-conductance mechanosensitive channel